ncbi:MAG: thioester domain-containing protein, partial [Tannerella sp.]|nr:thioester domain-containing protein [Tannerella sp.]
MKKFSLFLVALGACLLTFPEEVKAAPDTASYRLIVQYFDSIQIKYIVRHGLDEWWTTIGDVPIGVAKGGNNDSVTGQIYCIDATVPFHSYSGVKTSWPDGVTTDSVRNYVVATPFQYSDALRTNLDAILWLTVNGYTGHNLTAIQGNYGTNIDSTIALMATKIAIWHYTNERDFSLASTSLDTKDPARAAVMRQLVDALIRDAKVGATTFASLNVSIAKSTSPAAGFFPITLGPPEPVGDYYYYYGPFVVNESVSNGSGTFKLDSIFLSVGGVASEGVKFVKNSYGTPSTNIPLSEADMYGTSQKQPYVNN